MKNRILFIDDDANLLEGFRRSLHGRRNEWELSFSSSPDEAIRLLEKEIFDIVILDVMMPKLTGLDLLEKWHDRIQNGEFAVVMMTGLDDKDIKRRALDLGAIDLLNKPVQIENMTARIDNLLRMKSYRDSLLQRTEELNALNQRLMMEIKAREKVEDDLRNVNAELVGKNELLEELAIHDQLTGLHNRRFFDDKLEEYTRLCLRAKQPLSCIMLDLDHFKPVNDNYGHQSGDYVLKTLASAISEIVRTTDVLARYGGEEFILLLPYTKLVDGLILAEKLRALVEETEFEFENHHLSITISLGISELMEDEYDSFSLVSRADRALYCAKENGRNLVCSQDDIL